MKGFIPVLYNAILFLPLFISGSFFLFFNWILSVILMQQFTHHLRGGEGLALNWQEWVTSMGHDNQPAWSPPATRDRRAKSRVPCISVSCIPSISVSHNTLHPTPYWPRSLKFKAWQLVTWVSWARDSCKYRPGSDHSRICLLNKSSHMGQLKFGSNAKR